tara:strand:+ start:192 stop:293 length:102 start_codon:yes stop_codon:yes gene_type:complete
MPAKKPFFFSKNKILCYTFFGLKIFNQKQGAGF